MDPEQSEALKAIKERDGISESDQIRQAIDAWIERTSGTKKAASRRGQTRRKA